MYTLEGYQNPFRSRSSEATDAPGASASTSKRINMDESAYHATRLAPGVSFDSYKKPTAVFHPRGDYDTSVGAPTALTASDYLRKKYGDFSGATEVVHPPQVATQTAIMGKEALTVGDLKVLQNAIDLELIRLQNLRSVSALVTIKISQLQVLADNLADVKGRVDRGEIKVESVAIFPATARQFLKTFRSSENVPELFDPAGNSPASVAPSAAPSAPSSAGAAGAAATAPTIAPSGAPAPSSGPELLHWFYEHIQRLKWSLDADYDLKEAKQKEMSHSLNDMENRILGYSYTDTPMPEGYKQMFLQRIRGLQKELNSSPE